MRRLLAVHVRNGLVGLALAVMVSCGERSSPRSAARDASGVGAERGAAAGGMSAAALAVRTQWVADIDSLARNLARLESGVDALDGVRTQARSTAALRRLFRESRLAFKRAEFLTTYYEPTTAATINGPALPRVEAVEDGGGDVDRVDHGVLRDPLGVVVVVVGHALWL